MRWTDRELASPNSLWDYFYLHFAFTRFDTTLYFGGVYLDVDVSGLTILCYCYVDLIRDTSTYIVFSVFKGYIGDI